MTDLRLSEQQDAVALATKAMTQDLAEAYEVMGTLKAFNFVQKLLTVGSLKKLQDYHVKLLLQKRLMAQTV